MAWQLGLGRDHLIQPLRVRDRETGVQAGSPTPQLLSRGASKEQSRLSETWQEPRGGREVFVSEPQLEKGEGKELGGQGWGGQGGLP